MHVQSGARKDVWSRAAWGNAGKLGAPLTGVNVEESLGSGGGREVLCMHYSHMVSPSPSLPLQLLVVAPSQELAMQIVRVAQGLLPDEHRRMVQQCIGGANPKYQAGQCIKLPRLPACLPPPPTLFSDLFKNNIYVLKNRWMHCCLTSHSLSWAPRGVSRSLCASVRSSCTAAH